MTVLERVLRDFKFELPSTAVKTFKIDRATVAAPSETLQFLLKQNAAQQRDVLKADVAAFAARFQKDYGFELVFDESAIERLIELSLAADKTIRALCEDKFRDFHHGLKLIARDGELRRFEISREVVDAPDQVLSRWVVARFRAQGDPPSQR
jgi:ATP-dependent protease HslVU (ClpYQ) ATPase subunit